MAAYGAKIGTFDFIKMAQQNVTKLTYQLKKAEQEVEALKKKEKVKAIEFQTLQQSVSGRLKMQQQRINRLEQEVLEAKNARDVVTQELQKTLKQVIDMGKLDPESKASSLASTLERMEKEVEKLRKELETSKSAASDAEAKVCSLQTRLDLAEAEKAFAVRSMQESREVITKPLREKGEKSWMKPFFVSFSIAGFESVCRDGRRQ
jgi:chromosome segregation ATPase